MVRSRLLWSTLHSTTNLRVRSPCGQRMSRIGPPAAQAILPFDAATAVDDALQECLQEKLRTRLAVVEPLHPVLRMLPEERLEGGQQLDHVQPAVGVDVPDGVFHQPFLGGPGQLAWNDLGVDWIGDAQRRGLRDESEIADILDVAGSEPASSPPLRSGSTTRRTRSSWSLSAN